jgi:hypothetical protein
MTKRPPAKVASSLWSKLYLKGWLFPAESFVNYEKAARNLSPLPYFNRFILDLLENNGLLTQSKRFGGKSVISRATVELERKARDSVSIA